MFLIKYNEGGRNLTTRRGVWLQPTRVVFILNFIESKVIQYLFHYLYFQRLKDCNPMDNYIFALTVIQLRVIVIVL